MNDKISFSTGLLKPQHQHEHWHLEGWTGALRLRVEFDEGAAKIADEHPRRVLATAVRKCFEESRAAAVHKYRTSTFSHWLVAITSHDVELALQAQASGADFR